MPRAKPIAVSSHLFDLFKGCGLSMPLFLFRALKRRIAPVLRIFLEEKRSVIFSLLGFKNVARMWHAPLVNDKTAGKRIELNQNTIEWE